MNMHKYQIYIIFFVSFMFILPVVQTTTTLTIKLPDAQNILYADGEFFVYNTKDNKTIFLNLKTYDCQTIGNISPSVVNMPVVSYKKSIIIYDTNSRCLISLALETGRKKWSLQLGSDEYIAGTVLPAIFNDKLYFSIFNRIIVLSAENGTILNPENFNSSIKTPYSICNIIDEMLVDSSSMKMNFYNLYTLEKKDYSIYGRQGSEPASLINGFVFKYGNSFFIQNNAVSGYGRTNSFLEEVDISLSKTVNTYHTLYSSGIWINNNITYIFPVFNKHIIKFNLDDKSSSKLEVNDFFLPLGIYRNNFLYCSKDSIIKRDLEGKMVEQIKLGKMTYDNCRLFGNKIYFVDGEKLKIIQLETDAKPSPPFNFIKWILDIILRKLTGQP